MIVLYFIEDISAGEELSLQAEPKKEYDKFPVAIHCKGIMIGHVSRTDNKHISRLLRQSVELKCLV